MTTNKDSARLSIDVAPSHGHDDGAEVSSLPAAEKQREEATVYLQTHSHEWGDYTEADAKRVLRKIDWRLMPLIIVTITIAAVDKILISNAALYGMTEDANLVGQQYSWVGSIFYFGWLVAEYPANAILQKLPVGKVLGVATFLWGAVVMCMGAANNAAGLMSLRFIMGALEAPLFPSVTVLCSMWYRKSEQPTRMAITFMALSSLVTGVLSYAIGHTDTSLAPWRMLFVVIGGFTVLWGVILTWLIPDSPLKENFLRGKDKYIALDRIKDNMTGVENRTLKWYQVKEAFMDYKTYLLFVFFLSMNVPTGGLVTFAAQIVSGLGFGKLETTLLGMPTGVMQSIAGFMVAVPQKWLKNKRCLTAALCCLVPITCSMLIRDLPSENRVGRLLAYYFFYFFWGPYATALSLPMANVSGHTKKMTVNATVFLGYCLANVIGPQIFIAEEAPTYSTGYWSILGFEVAAILCLAAYAIGCYVENRKRDANEGSNVLVTLEDELADLTDYEKPGFRYIY